MSVFLHQLHTAFATAIPDLRLPNIKVIPMGFTQQSLHILNVGEKRLLVLDWYSVLAEK